MSGLDEQLRRDDRRSVGELLLDADLASRAALWDANPELAKARVRTWGEVVEAAVELWSAIPDRADDPRMRRISGITEALHRTQRRTQWPGAGPGDPHFESVATSLVRAAELVRARRHPTAPLSAAGHLDAEATRTRLMHVLHVSAHGVGVALGQHTKDLQASLDARHGLPPGESLRRARDAKERIAAVERLAGSYLSTRWPAALVVEHHESTEIGRLEQALASWDQQAHRTLAGPPVVANLDWIARVQQDLAVATGIVGAAAASRGLLDPDQHRDRLQPALANLGQSWGRLASDLERMLGRQRRLDTGLLLAGNETRAALREITHQHASLAGSEVMAARVDLKITTRSLHRDLTAAVDLAHITRDLLEDPRLTIAARGAQRMTARGNAPGALAASVDARDLHQNRDIPIPSFVRETLTRHAQGIIDKAIAASSAGAALQAPMVAFRGQPTINGRQVTINGRQHQDRTPPSISKPAPWIGCER